MYNHHKIHFTHKKTTNKQN